MLTQLARQLAMKQAPLSDLQRLTARARVVLQVRGGQDIATLIWNMEPLPIELKRVSLSYGGTAKGEAVAIKGLKFEILDVDQKQIKKLRVHRA